jgi:GxxExxY protein
MPDTELTRQIIGAAIEVHRLLGPGLLESAYESCLCHEFALRQIRFEKQKPIPLIYKETKLDCGFRLDLLVEGRVIVELKSVDCLGPVHEAIVLTYLKLSGYELGLLINFNVPVLKDGIRRFVMPRDKGSVFPNTEFTEDTEKKRVRNHG